MKNILLKFCFLLLIIPGIALAQTETGIKKAFTVAHDVAYENPYNTDLTVSMALGNIIQIVLSVIGVLFVIFMIYGGYIWMTAAGNDQKTEKAKSIITESILGIIIVIGAYAISYFVIYAFNSQIKL